MELHLNLWYYIITKEVTNMRYRIKYEIFYSGKRRVKKHEK